MFKFCAILSLILVIAKIFSLITLGWLLCLAPVLAYIAFLIIIAMICVAFGMVIAFLGLDKSFNKHYGKHSK